MNTNNPKKLCIKAKLLIILLTIFGFVPLTLCLTCGDKLFSNGALLLIVSLFFIALFLGLLRQAQKNKKIIDFIIISLFSIFSGLFLYKQMTVMKIEFVFENSIVQNSNIGFLLSASPQKIKNHGKIIAVSDTIQRGYIDVMAKRKIDVPLSHFTLNGKVYFPVKRPADKCTFDPAGSHWGFVMDEHGRITLKNPTNKCLHFRYEIPAAMRAMMFWRAWSSGLALGTIIFVLLTILMPKFHLTQILKNIGEKILLFLNCHTVMLLVYLISCSIASFALFVYLYFAWKPLSVSVVTDSTAKFPAGTFFQVKRNWTILNSLEPGDMRQHFLNNVKKTTEATKQLFGNVEFHCKEIKIAIQAPSTFSISAIQIGNDNIPVNFSGKNYSETFPISYPETAKIKQTLVLSTLAIFLVGFVICYFIICYFILKFRWQLNLVKVLSPGKFGYVILSLVTAFMFYMLGKDLFTALSGSIVADSFENGIAVVNIMHGNWRYWNNTWFSSHITTGPFVLGIAAILLKLITGGIRNGYFLSAVMVIIHSTVLCVLLILLKRLCNSWKKYLAAVCLTLFAIRGFLPIGFWSQIYGEVSSVLLTAIACLLLAAHKNKVHNLFFAGLLLGLAAFSKSLASITNLGVLFALLLYSVNLKTFFTRRNLSRMAIYVLAVISGIIVCSIGFWCLKINASSWDIVAKTSFESRGFMIDGVNPYLFDFSRILLILQQNESMLLKTVTVFAIFIIVLLGILSVWLLMCKKYTNPMQLFGAFCSVAALCNIAWFMLFNYRHFGLSNRYFMYSLVLSAFAAVAFFLSYFGVRKNHLKLVLLILSCLYLGFWVKRDLFNSVYEYYYSSIYNADSPEIIKEAVSSFAQCVPADCNVLSVRERYITVFPQAKYLYDRKKYKDDKLCRNSVLLNDTSQLPNWLADDFDSVPLFSNKFVTIFRSKSK